MSRVGVIVASAGRKKKEKVVSNQVWASRDFANCQKQLTPTPKSKGFPSLGSFHNDQIQKKVSNRALVHSVLLSQRRNVKGQTFSLFGFWPNRIVGVKRTNHR